MNIAFLTSSHDPFDDRIFYHLARSLSDRNNIVSIISSRQELTDVVDGININCFAGNRLSKKDKLRKFTEHLADLKPSVIICSEPLPLLAAKQYSKKTSGKIRIIYDVTEWYPSKKNLNPHNLLIRWFIFLKLLIFNFSTAGFADSFIFGEWYKSRPYRFLFPRKPFVYIPYYPNLQYIPFNEPLLQKNKLRLTYSGKISLEKGYGNFISVINTLIESRKDLSISVKIIGWYETDKDRSECEKLFIINNPRISIERSERQSFKKFLDLIKETDLFIDLRSDDFENQHCLPIKLFYFAAFGRPVIYSDLKSIRKEVEIDQFGFLINPADYKRIATLICDYLDNEKLYLSHCRNARHLAETKYSWQKTEQELIKFLSS
jgi:glycosyltransferase involved in cell wall biosynthesis